MIILSKLKEFINDIVNLDDKTSICILLSRGEVILLKKLGKYDSWITEYYGNKSKGIIDPIIQDEYKTGYNEDVHTISFNSFEITRYFSDNINNINFEQLENNNIIKEMNERYEKGIVFTIVIK